jgi:hypothetical protein
MEYRLFHNKYQANWDRSQETQPTEFLYSDGKTFKIFRLDCSGECWRAAFEKRLTYGTPIPKEDFDELVSLLGNPKSYGGGKAACFDPGFGLIVYDEEDVPTEYLMICMECNFHRTLPGIIDIKYENEYLKGFSRSTRRKLRAMFSKWGIDYYGYSGFYDDEAEYQAYLNAKDSASHY